MSESCGCINVQLAGVSGADVCTERMVRGQRAHKCYECGRAIAAGERHEFVRGLWEGCWSTYRTCVDCLSVRDEFFCYDWIYGGVWEHVGEHVRAVDGQIKSDCLREAREEADSDGYDRGYKDGSEEAGE